MAHNSIRVAQFIDKENIDGLEIFMGESVDGWHLDIITRNEVTFLYVLLECFKWISTYFKANNAINPYNIDLL